MYSESRIINKYNEAQMKPLQLCPAFISQFGVLSELQRREVHKLFMLPLNRPLLRRSNRYVFPSDPTTDGYLTNPHVGLAAPASRSCRIDSSFSLAFTII